VKLAPERKHLTNLLKMVAYQAESDLVRLLAPLSSAHRTRAIAALCQELNRTPTFFPGTRLRTRCDVRGPR